MTPATPVYAALIRLTRRATALFLVISVILLFASLAIPGTLPTDKAPRIALPLARLCFT